MDDKRFAFLGFILKLLQLDSSVQLVFRVLVYSQA